MQRFLKIIFFILLIIFLFFVLYYFFNEKDTNYETSLNINNLQDISLEAEEEELISHKGFSLSYNEEHEQANWVVYLLTKKMIEDRKIKRKNRFKSDPDIKTESAAVSDYTKSGYDRGHLAPAADMLWDEQAMLESFYMSNMSPQNPSFNRGIWKRLEAKVREWAIHNDSIIVITGPYLKDIDTAIGKNKVSVPKYFYKAVYDISAKEGYKAAGFWLPNEKGSDELLIPITIDELERKTGIDFFPTVNNFILEDIEATVKKSNWR